MFFKNYPRGMIAISAVELWERFSFYTMQSLLVLYAGAQLKQGGLGYTSAQALMLTGIYGGLVYISPVFAGIFADQKLGRRNAVYLGLVLMCLGHLSLAVHAIIAFYTGLVLLIIGCGFLKPTITAMVGELYHPDDPKREAGFSIFYMAINIGGIIGPLLGGVVSARWGYHIAFMMAAFGLVIGVINFAIENQRSLKNVGLKIKNQTVQPLLIPFRKISKIERQRVMVYLVMCAANILWNVIYALPYGLLTEYADKNIDRHLLGWQIPPTWYFGMYGFFIVLFSPMLASFYNYLIWKKINFTLSYKLAAGYFLVAIGCVVLLPLVQQIQISQSYLGSSWYLIGFYILFALSELLTVPVLLSAATRMAPKNYATSLIAANMIISWGLGAFLGGEFGALAVQYNAVKLFLGVIISTIIFGWLHLLFNHKVERLCEFKV